MRSPYQYFPSLLLSAVYRCPSLGALPNIVGIWGSFSVEQFELQFGPGDGHQRKSFSGNSIVLFEAVIYVLTTVFDGAAFKSIECVMFKG